jgi:extracellular factor (EF) 3-hydroxypalmitic acid methyl ester biosynthesis protein
MNMAATLDMAMDALHAGGHVGQVLSGVINSLDARRAGLSARQWKEWVGEEVRSHPVYPELLEDPFVRHSATRPRGYPGDAELLDFIYRNENVRPRIASASPLGQRLYRFSCETPAPEAVRLRSALAAAEVDRAAANGRRPHILSVACGHLREAPIVRSLAAGNLGRYVGADQDPRSLDLVRREYGPLGVEAVAYSVRDLLRRGDDLGRFDFIYCLGLYDYLSDETGGRLLKRLFGMLNPGGKVWVANFTGDPWSVGYMEAIMDWWLIYRSPEQMADFRSVLPASQVASSEVFLEPTGNVAFLEVVKAP